MIKPELYHKTVRILYNAYFDDTLRHKFCAACAVGNIIAANNGFIYKKDVWNTWQNAHPRWQDVFITTESKQRVYANEYDGIAKTQIDSTGYTWQELSEIEFAFERAPEGKNAEDWMFNGLVAVLEVLKEIHQVTDEDLLQANNKRFKDHYARRVSVAV